MLLMLQQVFIGVLLLQETPNMNSLVVGSIAALLGAVLKFWCQSHDVWDHGVPRSGPFLWVRQPNILGDLAICIGLVLSSASVWTALLFLAASVWVLRLKVLDIEAYRLRKLGIPYAKYAAEVPLIFPNRLIVTSPELSQKRPLKAVIFEKNQRGILQVITIAGFFVIGVLKNYFFSHEYWLVASLVATYMLFVAGWYVRLGRSGHLVRH